MRLTRKLMLGVEAALDIAYHAADGPVQSKEIAARQGIPRRYLEQVLQTLVHAGLLSGVRGPRGGYRLARPRNAVSVAEIVRAIEAADAVDDPLADPAVSELGRAVLTPFWRALEDEATARLEATTVEDLCRSAQAAGIESLAQREFDFMAS